MPYFIEDVEKTALEQRKAGGQTFGTETTEMSECHQENVMRSAKHIHFNSCQTLGDGVMPEIARDCLC